MKQVRFGIIGMGTRGSLCASILTGRQHPGKPVIPRPRDCLLTAISSRSDKSGEAGLRQVELANAIALSGWTGEMDSFPCDSVR